jgi:hypothetical protein
LTEQLEAVALTACRLHDAKLDAEESRVKLTDPEGAVEPEPDRESLTVVVQESVESTGTEDVAQTMDVIVDWRFTFRLKVPWLVEWSESPMNAPFMV